MMTAPVGDFGWFTMTIEKCITLLYSERVC